MVVKEQIKNGFKNYIVSEIINKMQLSPNSIKRGLIVTGINLWADHNVDSMLSDTEGASAFGIVDADGRYDIDKLVSEFKKTMPPQGYALNLSLAGFKLGDITFYSDDLDSLVRYIYSA